MQRSPRVGPPHKDMSVHTEEAWKRPCPDICTVSSFGPMPDQFSHGKFEVPKSQIKGSKSHTHKVALKRPIYIRGDDVEHMHMTKSVSTLVT